MMFDHRPITLDMTMLKIRVFTEIQESYFKWQILGIYGHFGISKMPVGSNMIYAVIMPGFNRIYNYICDVMEILWHWGLATDAYIG